VVRQPDVNNRNAVGATSVGVGDDSVQCSAALMCRSSIVEHDPLAVHQQEQLISIRVVGTIEPSIEVADNIDRYLIDRETIKNK